MARRPVPSPFARCLTALRVAKGWQQGQLARTLGIPEKTFTRYENGQRNLSREALERFIAPMGLGPEAIDSTLFWLETLGVEVPEPPPGPPFEPAPGERHWISRGAIAMAWKTLRATLSALTQMRAVAQAHQARSEAPKLWERLRSFAPGDQAARRSRPGRLLVAQRDEASPRDTASHRRDIAA
jgi:transcriptional regulator with XRE-family HTH domain